MRAILFFITSVCLQLNAVAQDQSSAFSNSGAAQNLVMSVGCPKSIFLDSESNSPIAACILTQTKSTETIHFPKSQYFCRISLVDSNNIELTKTRAGRSYGESFFTLTNFSPEVIGTNGRNTGGSMRPDIGTAHANSGTCHELPPLQSLFEIKTRGHYKLRLQFQVFKVVGTPPNYLHNLVRLPAMEVEIEVL